MINHISNLYVELTNRINQMDWVKCLDFALSGQSLSGAAHQHLGGIVRRAIIRGFASLVELASRRPIEATICAVVIAKTGSCLLHSSQRSRNKHEYRQSSRDPANRISNLVTKQCAVS